MTNHPQPRRPARIETRNEITGLIGSTRTGGTPCFPGWGPKLL
jgi:hypothetical protein